MICSLQANPIHNLPDFFHIVWLDVFWLWFPPVSAHVHGICLLLWLAHVKRSIFQSLSIKCRYINNEQVRNSYYSINSSVFMAMNVLMGIFLCPSDRDKCSHINFGNNLCREYPALLSNTVKNGRRKIFDEECCTEDFTHNLTRAFNLISSTCLHKLK